MPQETENGLDLREQFLRTVFRKMLGPSIKQAKSGQEVTAGAIVKQLGNIYFGTGKCVLVESHGMSADFDKLSDGIHQMAGYPQKEIKDINKMRPEVLLCQTGAIELGMEEFGYEYTYLPVSRLPDQKMEEATPMLLVLRRIDDNTSILVNQHPLTGLMQNLRTTPYRIPPVLSECVTMERPAMVSYESVKPTMTRSLLADMLVLVLHATRSLFYSSLMACYKDESVFNIRTADEKVIYTVDGWDDATKSYKKIIRKRRTKMPKGLTNPTKKATEAAATVTPAPTTPAPQPAPAPAAPQMPPAGTYAGVGTTDADNIPKEAPAVVHIPDANPPIQDAPAQEPQTEEFTKPVDATTVPVTVTPGTAEVQAHQEAPVQVAVEPAKRTRIKKPSTKQMDLQNVIDNLSAAIPEYNGDIEAMMNDLRPLRDLTIAVARRSANISAELFKAASQRKGEEDRLAQIRKLLG